VASKAAVINLVRQAAVELAPHGVLVNAIAHGPFATELNGGRLKLPESAERMRTYIPLGRIATVDEIKGWLCCWPQGLPATSPEPSFQSTAGRRQGNGYAMAGPVDDTAVDWWTLGAYEHR